MTATDVQPDRMTAAREAAGSFAEGPARRLQGRRRLVLRQGRRRRAADRRPRRGGQGARARSRPRTARPSATRSRARSTSASRASTRTSQATARSKDANGQSPLVILLLSDGASTTGDYTPLEAAQLAKDASVPVYTVALGTENGTIQGPDGFGGVRTIRVPPDPETLKQVAETDRRQVLRRRRRRRAEERVRPDRLAGRRRAQDARADGVLHRRRRALLLAGAGLSMLWFARLP